MVKARFHTKFDERKLRFALDLSKAAIQRLGALAAGTAAECVARAASDYTPVWTGDTAASWGPSQNGFAVRTGLRAPWDQSLQTPMGTERNRPAVRSILTNIFDIYISTRDTIPPNIVITNNNGSDFKKIYEGDWITRWSADFVPRIISSAEARFRAVEPMLLREQAREKARLKSRIGR